MSEMSVEDEEFMDARGAEAEPEIENRPDVTVKGNDDEWKMRMPNVLKFS